MNKFVLLPLLLSILIVSGCVDEVPEVLPTPVMDSQDLESSSMAAADEESQASESEAPETTPLASCWCTVYFTGEDDVEGSLVEFINSSQSTIHAAIYDLSLPAVANAIINASERGVNVVLIMDDKQAERDASLYNYLNDSGILVALDNSKSNLMHNKVVVADGERIWAGSTNPTYNGVNLNNNNALIIESPELADNYIVEIEEMWLEYQLDNKTVMGTPHSLVEIQGITVENYFAPEDGVEDEILSELDSASSSIYFMIFTFTSDPIEQKLVEKYNQGLDVKGIFEKRQTYSEYAAYEPLLNASVPVIVDENGYTMHHKVFIIDNSTTITGSYNPTKAANTKNDENVLIIHDPEVTQEFLDEFDKLWCDWCD